MVWIGTPFLSMLTQPSSINVHHHKCYSDISLFLLCLPVSTLSQAAFFLNFFWIELRVCLGFLIWLCLIWLSVPIWALKWCLLSLEAPFYVIDLVWILKWRIVIDWYVDCLIVFVLIFWFWWFNRINPTISGAPISIVKIDAMEAQIKVIFSYFFAWMIIYVLEIIVMSNYCKW